MNEIIARLLIFVGVFIASPYLPAHSHAHAGTTAAVVTVTTPAG